MSDAPAPRRWHAALRLLLFLVLFVGLAFAGGRTFRFLGVPRPVADDVARPVPMLAFSVLLVLAGLLATWAVLRWTERRGLGTVGLGTAPAPLQRAALGFLGGALTPTVVLVAYALTGIATITPGAPDLLRDTLPVFVAFLLVSSAEEIQLRGYLMQAVAQMSRPWVAAVVSGAIFGLVHAGNPGANPAGLIFTGVNGVLLALLVIRTGSLWLACGYHAGWNVTAAVVFGMRDSGMVHPGALVVTELHGPDFLTGGAYGFEAAWPTGGVEAMVLAILLVVAPRLAADPDAREYYRGRLPAPPEPPQPQATPEPPAPSEPEAGAPRVPPAAPAP